MEEKRFLKLSDISAYKISFVLSNYVWRLVVNWDYFCKETIGKQFVRSVDSISSNIAEGFGRYGKKDKIKFYYYSLGSIKESLDWNQKAKSRRIISQEQHQYIFSELDRLPREIHNLISFTRKKLND
ncbi:MAG TPA: four helix bundle protein [bacterium]|nr:four helix bundle protein [bacterium]HPW39313.1 four helix bundle protein [bacterium]HQA63728.1 four helix bundle protein [bacterium]